MAILPPLTYTAAAFAQGFAGTLSLRPETVTATVLDIAGSLTRHGFGVLAIANAHLDPGHLASLEAAVNAIRRDLGLAVAFPNLAAKPWALRLSDEFRSGACHAGQFETSIVLAERPELVREATQGRAAAQSRRRSPVPSGMASELRGGGRPRAYFGYPAQATAEEGRATIEILGGDSRRSGPGGARARTGQANEYLAGRVAVVTGAGRGIGAATARALADAGLGVVLAARTRDQIERQAAELVGDRATGRRRWSAT